MQQMKTATIQVFPLFQSPAWGINLGYKGKLLETIHTIDKNISFQELLEKAKSQGFTHAKDNKEDRWGKIEMCKIKL